MRRLIGQAVFLASLVMMFLIRTGYKWGPDW
jgi:hypothetical protein